MLKYNRGYSLFFIRLDLLANSCRMVKIVKITYFATYLVSVCKKYFKTERIILLTLFPNVKTYNL